MRGARARADSRVGETPLLNRATGERARSGIPALEHGLWRRRTTSVPADCHHEAMTLGSDPPKGSKQAIAQARVPVCDEAVLTGLDPGKNATPSPFEVELNGVENLDDSS